MQAKLTELHAELELLIEANIKFSRKAGDKFCRIVDDLIDAKDKILNALTTMKAG